MRKRERGRERDQESESSYNLRARKREGEIKLEGDGCWPSKGTGEYRCDGLFKCVTERGKERQREKVREREIGKWCVRSCSNNNNSNNNNNKRERSDLFIWKNSWKVVLLLMLMVFLLGPSQSRTPTLKNHLSRSFYLKSALRKCADACVRKIIWVSERESENDRKREREWKRDNVNWRLRERAF